MPPTVRVAVGDCRDVLSALPDASVDSIVTDPPYAIGFMGKDWDHAGVAFDSLTWAAAKRVLKPGGYLLAFGGTRTSHRLACAIEDAGLEIRDTIMWVHSQGFPKNARLQLKPAHEPIIMARRPMIGSLDQNVAAHGTGALNIDDCRIPATDKAKFPVGYSKGMGNDTYAQDDYTRGMIRLEPDPNPGGRWPANIVFDEYRGAELDQQTGVLTSGGVGPDGLVRGQPPGAGIYGNGKGLWKAPGPAGEVYADSGGASRFFYCPKATAAERVRVDGVSHPTVKPLSLMQWLIRLVTPAGGVVLDMFAGSGTTGEAAVNEGRSALLIEQGHEYLPLIRIRLARVKLKPVVVKGPTYAAPASPEGLTAVHGSADVSIAQVG